MFTAGQAAAAAPAAPVAAVAVVDAANTIRLRVEKFSKLKEPVESEMKEIGGFPWSVRVSCLEIQ